MKREWDPGTYTVTDSIKGYVGKVYVTGTAGVSTVEHYILLDFVSPNFTHSTTVDKATLQYTKFDDFWDDMKAEVTQSGMQARYVKAVCTYSTMLP